MKKTSREMFVTLLNVVANAEMPEIDKSYLTDFINSRIEQIDKKANTVTKAEKEKQELNNKISEMIIDGLVALDKPSKVSELIKNYEPLNIYSTQKLTPIITNLVKQNKLDKTTVKREVFYSVKTA